jgi:TetR/AcrR family transcriptional regulator
MAVRDGERTKESILAAAEDLFARQGFERTSMQQIGDAAGVARSTPAYFFRSKEALYEAVLARAVERAEEAITRAYAADDGHRVSEGTIESYASALIDFLASDRAFVCLIQRESLGDGHRVSEFLGRLADHAVAVFTPAAQQAGVSPQRLVLDVVALSWYPLAHEHTLLPALGMNPREPAFLEEQRRHIADVVQALTRARGKRPPKT